MSGVSGASSTVVATGRHGIVGAGRYRQRVHEQHQTDQWPARAQPVRVRTRASAEARETGERVDGTPPMYEARESAADGGRPPPAMSTQGRPARALDRRPRQGAPWDAPRGAGATRRGWVDVHTLSDPAIKTYRDPRLGVVGMALALGGVAGHRDRHRRERRSPRLDQRLLLHAGAGDLRRRAGRGRARPDRDQGARGAGGRDAQPGGHAGPARRARADPDQHDRVRGQPAPTVIPWTSSSPPWRTTSGRSSCWGRSALVAGDVTLPDPVAAERRAAVAGMVARKPRRGWGSRRGSSSAAPPSSSSGTTWPRSRCSCCSRGSPPSMHGRPPPGRSPPSSG